MKLAGFNFYVLWSNTHNAKLIFWAVGIHLSGIKCIHPAVSLARLNADSTV